MSGRRPTHGARSEIVVTKVALVQKRRLLRQIGLRQSELEGIGLALLDNYCRAQAKVELLDTYAATHGVLDADGVPLGYTKIYFVALNSARLSLCRLNEHLRDRSIASGTALAQYLTTLEEEDGNGNEA